MLLLQPSSAYPVRSAKLVSAIAGALGITFVLFATMQQLIAVKGAPPRQVTDMPVVTLYEPVKGTELAVKQAMPKMPEPKLRDLPPATPAPVDTVSISPDGFNITAPKLAKMSGRDGLNQADRAATPLVRIEPRYPVHAARDGISGWVQLGFSIDETGAVTDVVVLTAEPARIFDREAIAALKRWKYQPKRVDGIAVKQTGMQVQLDFNLDNG